jgi:hypothetical protein
MKNLEAMLNFKGKINYPDDVARLKRHIPELETVTDEAVQYLYHTFSEDLWCASWLIMNRDSIEEFREYLLKDVGEDNHTW